jgi:RNA polymerase sigma-70 factor (ECF subfamily)
MIQSLEATVRLEGLISRAKKGERDAFASLYHEYFKPVYRYIYMRVGQVEQAEDLAQEVFLKALNDIDSFRYQEVPFGSWIFRIAHNLLVDHYRRFKKESARINVPIAITGANDDHAGAVEQEMEAQAIKKAIEMLPPRQREIISMRFGAEMSIEETAKAIGATKGTVEKLQYEALAEVKRLVGNDQET